MSSDRGTWTGTDSEGGNWLLEIEPDCFNEADGLVVSIWAEDSDSGTIDKAVETLITASPAQAREMAAVLLKAADSVEAGFDRAPSAAFRGQEGS